MGLNRVVLTGRLTADPELRYTQTGRARTRFSIAVNRRYRDQEGNFQEETTFVPIVVWGPQAESCANYLQKGRQVAVDGRLRIDTFETQEGERRKVIEVVAQRVEFLGGRREEAEEPAEEPQPAAEAESPQPQAEPEEEIPF
ncbi:MAG: single-stranded DNA-binding protein [Candidatus Bipolaricaulia bacterium]